MPVIYCGAVDCEYNGKNNHCTAKKINLSDNYVHTVHEGLQHFNRCKTYVESKETKRLKKLFCVEKEGG